MVFFTVTYTKNRLASRKAVLEWGGDRMTDDEMIMIFLTILTVLLMALGKNNR